MSVAKDLHIVIVNAHWSNRGDEAAHRALWAALRQRYPGCRLTVLFKDRQGVQQVPPLGGLAWYSCQFKAPLWDIWTAALSRGRLGRNPLLKRMARTLSTADLIVYPPGGAVISDRFFWSKQMEYLTPFLCARLYGIPLVVAAPSMGPFDAVPRRPLRRWLLRTPRVFCVREDLSRQYLAKIGIRDGVTVTMDLAFLDEIDIPAAERRLANDPALTAFLAAHPRVLGLTLSDFTWHVKLSKEPGLVDRIADTARRTIRALTERGDGVLLIPQLFGNQNDYADLQACAGEGVFVMSDRLDTYVQQYVIAKLYAVIGMRYHSNIFAAKMGTPFVAIVYEEKMAGFLELAGLGDYGLPLTELTYESLAEKIRALEEHYTEFRARLAQGLPEWRQRARRTVDLLPDLA